MLVNGNIIMPSKKMCTEEENSCNKSTTPTTPTTKCKCSLTALRNVVIEDETPKFSTTLHKDQGVYVSSLTTPLCLYTPTVVLASELRDTNDEMASFASLQLKSSVLTFFQQFEEAIIKLAIARKAEWFKEDIDDAVIREGLKSFVDAESKSLRVRVPENCTAFDVSRAKTDLPCEGTRVKAILELARITFSKTQFGIVWKLKQLQLADDTRCLFDEDTLVQSNHTLKDTLDDTLLAVDDEDIVVDISS